MKNILFIINYITFPWEGGNSRFTYLLNLFNYKKNKIELFTTDFLHSKKERRILCKEYVQIPYKVSLIHELGYKKNVSLKRLISSYILGHNLWKKLNNSKEKYDIIYCSVPSIEFAYKAAKYAKKNNIKFIIDIQDLWPESFKMVFNIPVISNLIFYPMMKKVNYVYASADEIVAVSDTYVDRALSVNKKLNKGLSVYLGTDLNYFDKCKKENFVFFNDNIIRVVYIGTLGTSYNIKLIIDAIKYLKEKNINNIKFVCIGDGPSRSDFEDYARNSGIDYEFTGRIDYPKMVGLLCACDIAVNPINGKSVASIINKVGDYAASGLPVINTQNSEEYKKLIDMYNAGFNCKKSDSFDVADKLEILINDKKLRIKKGKGNRKLAQEKFDRKHSYDKIVNIIEGDFNE